MQFFKNGFHSLQRLKVCSSKESRMFDDEAMQEVMKSLRSLKGLCLQSCTALQSIHTVLHLLPCLETLSISDCPFLHSLPSLLPPSIRQLQVAHCDEKLMIQLDKYKEMLRPFDTSFSDFWTDPCTWNEIIFFIMSYSFFFRILSNFVNQCIK